MGEAVYCDVPPKKIRRHLPPGTGNYSVGCVDIMCDHTVNGSFFRLFYPIEKTDVYVSKVMEGSLQHVHVNIYLSLFIYFEC